MATELKYNIPINLGNNELRNVRLQNLAVDPTANESVIFYSTAHRSPRYHDGTGFFNLDPRKATGIPLSALATDPLARGNHTGTQLASTISNFDTQVRTSRLDQMAAPTTSVSFNNQKITNLLTPTLATDAATKGFVESASTSGNAATATTLQTSRNFALTGVVSASAVGFNGSGNLTLTTTIANNALTIGMTNGLQAALDAKLDDSQLGTANGIATLDNDGKVPASQLPSYVDDVLEAASFAALPATGETGKIYVTVDDGKIYRWTGSVYVNINASAGSADTAVKLATARTFTIAGVVSAPAQNFDGTANVTLTTTIADSALTIAKTAGLQSALDGKLASGATAVAAAKLETARTFSLTGIVTAAGVTFDGSGNVTLATAIADNALTIAKTAGLQTALDLRARKYTTSIGNTTDTVYTITHNLGTKDVVVSVRNAVSDDIEMCGISAPTVNTVTVTVATPPGSNAFSVTVLG